MIVISNSLMLYSLSFESARTIAFFVVLQHIFSDIVINAGHVDTEAKVALHATVCKQSRRKQVLNLSIWSG